MLKRKFHEISGYKYTYDQFETKKIKLHHNRNDLYKTSKLDEYDNMSLSTEDEYIENVSPQFSTNYKKKNKFKFKKYNNKNEFYSCTKKKSLEN